MRKRLERRDSWCGCFSCFSPWALSASLQSQAQETLREETWISASSERVGECPLECGAISEHGSQCPPLLGTFVIRRLSGTGSAWEGRGISLSSRSGSLEDGGPALSPPSPLWPQRCGGDAVLLTNPWGGHCDKRWRGMRSSHRASQWDVLPLSQTRPGERWYWTQGSFCLSNNRN